MRELVVIGMLVSLLGSGAGWADPGQAPAGERAERSTQVGTVDLNTADQVALESLPGIGPRTAELIIEYRREHGGFKKIEELMNVRGIGEKSFLRLRELVSVSVPQP